MRKLNKKKIKWILKEMQLGKLSVWRIAKQQKITPRHARRVFTKFRDSKNITLLKPGRTPKPITEQEVKTVNEIRAEHPFGAVNLEKILKEEGKHTPHNRIHKILLQQGFSKKEPKKSKRRKWIRYERKHSNSLWHTDYSKIDGKHFIAFEDDASRLITSYGEFKKETAEHAVQVLEKGIQVYGIPKAIVNDHGTQFVSLKRKDCQNPADNLFQQTLKKYGIKQIKARVKHPQTNGKLERLFYTISQLKKHFGNTETAIHYYNFKRPHMSLENGSLRVPFQAFIDKLKVN